MEGDGRDGGVCVSSARSKLFGSGGWLAGISRGRSKSGDRDVVKRSKWEARTMGLSLPLFLSFADALLIEIKKKADP